MDLKLMANKPSRSNTAAKRELLYASLFILEVLTRKSQQGPRSPTFVLVNPFSCKGKSLPFFFCALSFMQFSTLLQRRDSKTVLRFFSSTNSVYHMDCILQSDRISYRAQTRYVFFFLITP